MILLKTDQSAGFQIGFSDISGYQGVFFGNDSSFLKLSTLDATLAATLIDGNWHHIVLTYDGVSRTTASSYTLYVDGSPKSVGVASVFSPVPNENRIGHSTNAGNWFSGNIDEVSIFSSELTSGNVTTLYNSGVPNDISGLNPVAYYKMGEGAIFPQIPNEMAYSKQSLDFDGIDDYVDCGATVTDLGITNKFTVSCWIKADTLVGSWEGVIGCVSSDAWTDGFAIYMNSSGTIGFWINHYTTNLAISATSTISTGTWYHVLACYDGSLGSNNMELFVDGVSVATDTLTANVTDNSGTLCMCDVSSGGFHHGMNGNVDDVAVWNTDKRADVATIYNSGSPADLSSLSPTSYWKMGDGDYFPTITDSGSGGNDGTAVNESGSVMIQLDTPNGWGTAYNETAAEMIQGDTPGGNGGTMMINMTQSDIVQDAPKYSRLSVDFDGLSQYMNITDSASVPTDYQGMGNNNAYSFFCWIKTTGGAGGGLYWFPDDTIVELRTQEPTDVEVPFSFGVASNKLWFGRTSDSLTTDEAVAGVATVNDGNWHHVGFTIDNDAWVLYVDGSSDASGTFTVATGDCSVGTQTSNFQFGCRTRDPGDHDRNFFAGNIDEAAFWNTALTSGNVKTIYNNGRPTDISSLSPVGWWRMGEGSTFPTIIDDGSGSNNGAMTNMAAADIENDTPG